MRALLATIAIALSALLVVGCAQFSSPDQRPQVQLIDVVPIGSSGVAPRFLVRLQVINRGRRALNVAGISYNLALNGDRVMTGITSEAVSVPAFGQAMVDVDATMNLIGSLRMITSLLAAPGDVEYELETLLYSRWWPAPITVVDRGILGGGSTQAPR